VPSGGFLNCQPLHEKETKKSKKGDRQKKLQVTGSRLYVVKLCASRGVWFDVPAAREEVSHGA